MGNDNTVKWRGLGWRPPPEARCGRISCAPSVRVTNTLAAHLAIFHGLIGWPITTPRENRAMMPNWLHEPLRQPACGFVDNAARCPTTPQAQKRSIHARP